MALVGQTQGDRINTGSNHKDLIGSSIIKPSEGEKFMNKLMSEGTHTVKTDSPNKAVSLSHQCHAI